MWVFATMSAASGQLDKIVIGALIGAGPPVGFYERAFRLCQMPAMSVAELSNRLSFPAYSRNKHDRDFVRAGFFRSIRHVALAVVPMSIGLAAIADPFVVVALGEEWIESADVMRILAFYGASLAISSTIGPVLLGLGRPNVLMWSSFLYQGVMIAGMFLLFPLGIVGIAIAVLLASLASATYAVAVVSRVILAPVRDILMPVARTVFCSLPMLAAVLVARELLPLSNPALELALAVALGAVVYVLTSRLFNRGQVDELLNTIGRTVQAR
jgi:PST family polysaccharide transporter